MKRRRMGLFVALGASIAIAAGAAPLRYEIRKVHQNQPGRWEATAEYAQFRSDSPVARLANWTLITAAHEGVDGFIRESRKYQSGGVKTILPYNYTSKPAVTLAGPTLISVYCTIDEYTGGAHGLTAFAAYTFGLQNGRARQLSLQSLFKPGVSAAKLLLPVIFVRLKEDPTAVFVRDGTVKATPQLLGNWVLTRTGLVFLFEPYAVGPYSAGSFKVSIPYSQLQGQMNLEVSRAGD